MNVLSVASSASLLTLCSRWLKCLMGTCKRRLSKVASVTGSPNYLSVKNVKRTLPFSPMRHEESSPRISLTFFKIGIADKQLF